MGRSLILGMSVSMDGFVAGPNGEIDWIFANRSEASTAWIVERLEGVGLHLMGHRSYREMADFWPTSTLPMAGAMNRIPKAVFSRSGTIPAPSMERSLAAGAGVDAAVVESWRNPRVGGADLVADIGRLKAEEGGPINALGGASFVSSLVAAGLVDEFRLMVHPVALGRGLSLFAEMETPLRLELVGLERFDHGVLAKTYRPMRTQDENRATGL